MFQRVRVSKKLSHFVLYIQSHLKAHFVLHFVTFRFANYTRLNGVGPPRILLMLRDAVRQIEVNAGRVAKKHNATAESPARKLGGPVLFSYL